LLTAILTLGFFFTVTYALAQADEPIAPALPIVQEQAKEPVTSQNQSVIIDTDETKLGDTRENWEPSSLQTYGTKFLIRGKEALTWSLNIEDSGFHNPAIQTSYVKVLTIVNSLFILGLLAIAAMWMLSIIIPRRYLKQVMLYFAAAVIFVNFAMPLTRLFIDSTNLLQKTLLVQDGKNIAIADIVKTPTYGEAIGYENLTPEKSAKKIGIALTENPAEKEVTIGKVSGPERQILGIVNGEPAEIIDLTMQPTDDQKIVLNPDQQITVTGESGFHSETEQSIFSFIMIAATGLAYFALALIFVLRIVILWALLILSPILFLLGIFKLTRGWFWNWLAIYGRWLFIGPLVALGIAVIVNIWKTVGLPITVNSAFTGAEFGSVSNISFLLPGDTTPNTLSTTGEMMEYLVFLMMLYMPIFFGFALTRQKILHGVMTTVVEKWGERRPVLVTPTGAELGGRVTEKIETRAGVLGTLRDMFTTQIARVTETVMPGEMRGFAEHKGAFIPSAANFLPEQLKLTDFHGMLELLGASKESRHSRDLAVEKLANPAIIRDPKEREKHAAVRNEIERRADIGHPEAVILMNEIHEKEKAIEAPKTQAETRVKIDLPQAKETGPIIERVTQEKETEKKTERVIIEKEKPAKGAESVESAEESKGEEEETEKEEEEVEGENKEKKEGKEGEESEPEEIEPAENEKNLTDKQSKN
jgi:hypothetical protein